MALSKGSPCPACVRNWTDFLNILDPGDVGVTIYRYRGPARDEMGRSDTTRETIIFCTTKNVTEPCEEMGLDMITAKYPKCVNYCPRCKKMMRRLEALFKNSPSVLDTDFCELFSCPPCTDIAHKFLKFTAKDFKIQVQDSELIHLQRLTTPGDEDAFGKSRIIFEDLVKAGASQQDGEQTKKDEAGGTQKDKDLKKKVIPPVKDKGFTKKGTAPVKELKAKSEMFKDKERAKTESATDIAVKTAKKGRERAKKESATDIAVKTAKKERERAKKESATDIAVKTVKKEKATDTGVKNKSTGKSGKSSLDIKKEKKEKESKYDLKVEKSKTKAKTKEPQKQQTQSELAKQLLKEAADMEEKTKLAREKAEEASKRLREAIGPQTEEAESDDRTDVCSDETADDHIIIGDRIYKASKEEREEEPVAKTLVPTAFTSVCMEKSPPPTSITTDGTTPPKKKHCLKTENKISVNYILSDRKYVENGWTQLPKEMVMQRIALFHMYPPRNNFDWLEMNRHKRRVLYDSGEQLATFEENRRSRIYYRSGVVALDYYQAEDVLAGGYRVVVYANVSHLERRALPTVLAVFDYSGNGIVFDQTGQPRLKYTQNEGVVLDRSIGPYTHWKWHNLNHSGRLQTVMVDNEPLIKDQDIIRLAEQESLKDDHSRSKGKGDGTSRGESHKSSTKGVSGSTGSPDKSSNKAVRSEHSRDKLAVIPEQGTVVSFSNDEALMSNIEWQNVIKENASKRFLPYQIKMKVFKINENFSLRIIEQSSVYLTFTDGKTRLKLNVGMIMDPTMLLSEQLVEVGDVASVLDRLPASESMEQLEMVVKGARAAERARVLREHRINAPVPVLSDTALEKVKRRTT